MNIIVIAVHMHLIWFGIVSAWTLTKQVKPDQGRGEVFVKNILYQAGAGVAAAVVIVLLALAGQDEGDTMPLIHVVVQRMRNFGL